MLGAASYLLSALPLVRRLIRTYHYDAVHVFFSLPTGALLPFAGLGEIPVVVSLRGSDVPGYDPYNIAMQRAHRVLAPLTRWIWRRADRVVAVCESLGRLSAETCPGLPYSVVPNGVDLRLFHPPEKSPADGRIRCLAVARLVERKGLGELIQAFALLPRNRYELEIVGRGPDEGVLRDLAGRLDVAQEIRFSGALDRAAVAQRYRDAHLFTLPSSAEAFGNVFAEALASGLPVVGCNVGGIPELIEHGRTGLLVDPEDLEGLADALVSVLTDREAAERFGREAHALYESIHTTPAEYADRVRALVEASLRDAGAVPGERPRVLIVGRRTYQLPLRGATAAALGALRETVDYCVVGLAAPDAKPVKTALGPGSFHLLRRWPGPLDALVFHASLPFRVARLVRRFKPRVIIAESPHLGFLVLLALAFRRRSRPSLVIETYGDWRSSVRYGGSRARRLVAPLADWAARYALRRAVHGRAR
jgi:glycosyltransferase involved in cell wall biosynthesis